jgi:hypothetical protein
LSVSKFYTKEIKYETNYSATWLPSVTVSPGDVGRIKDYQFQHLTSLSTLGIPFSTSPGVSKLDFNYYSANAVSVTMKASGQAPLVGSGLAQADAGVNIRFQRDNAVIFRLRRGSSTRISDLNSLEKNIIPLHDADTWKDDMVVVTEAVVADSATIIISRGSNAQIDLLARGQVGAAGIDLADIDANLQVVKESNIDTKIIASKGLTPLFKALGMRKSWWSGQRKLGLRPPAGEARFAPVDYDDYEDGV